MQHFLLGVWREEEGHLKQLKRMLSFLASPVFSPYFLFPSAAFNLSRVSHRGLPDLPVWPCFSQALDLEGLFVRQDWVSGRPIVGSVERTVCGASEAVSEILLWGPECKPKLLVGSCKFFKSSERIGTNFLQLTRRLTEKKHLSHPNLESWSRSRLVEGDRIDGKALTTEKSLSFQGLLFRGEPCVYTEMLSWSGFTSLAWMRGWIQGFPSGRSAGHFSHPGPHFTRVTFFCVW